MITRLAVKSSLLGSVGGTAYVSTIIDIPDNDKGKSFSAEISEKQRKHFQTREWKTMTLEDVEMFERRRGCKFAFTDDFKSNKNYTVREWFNEKVKKEPTKEKSLREAFAVAVVYNTKNCKSGQVLVIEPQGKFNDLGPKLSY